jgi:hypothetical protein
MTPNVLTSLTPFSFSISVSFGGSPVFLENNQQPHEQTRPSSDEPSETYIPQTLVIGVFFAIFCAQVGINFLQVVRRGRRRRQAMELQFPQPVPPQPRGQDERSEPVANATLAGGGGDGEEIPASGSTHDIG